MWNKEQQETWEDIQNIWNTSSHRKKIKIDSAQLIMELKNKTSEFEKRAVQKDFTMIQGAISQFEKDSIQSDLNVITNAVKKFLKRIQKKKD